MYKLEDDKEATSSLGKRDEVEAAAADEVSLLPVKEPTVGLPVDGSGQAEHMSLRTQVTNALKRITTPAQTQKSGKRVAVAALAIACVSVFFTAMDQTVVVTALPPIISALNVSPTKLNEAAWIVSAYLLGFVVAMPLMGRVSDIYGR